MPFLMLKEETSMQYDLIIHNAQLHRHTGLVEIAVQDGRFARISSEIPPRQLRNM